MTACAELMAIKGPGFRVRHRLEAVRTHDGVPIGQERVVDMRQRRAHWYRLNIMDKAQALAILTKDLIAHDRKLAEEGQS